MKKMKLINKTPHVIHIYDEEGEQLLLTLEPEGEPARLFVTSSTLPPLNDVIPLSTTEFGFPSELPDFHPNVMYIVSNLYRERSARLDLLSPGLLLRDAFGQVYGCRGLIK